MNASNGGGKASGCNGYEAMPQVACEGQNSDMDEDEDKDMEDDGDDVAELFEATAEEATRMGIDDELSFGEALSLFGPGSFPSAAAFWKHAAEVHNFSIERLRVEIGQENWSDYHKMRLVNYLRSLGPEAAREQAKTITAASSIWADEKWLQPVLDDDCLLFDDEDEDGDDCAGFGGNGDESDGDFPIDLTKVEPALLIEEVQRLQAELSSARRILAAAQESSLLTVGASSSPEVSQTGLASADLSKVEPVLLIEEIGRLRKDLSETREQLSRTMGNEDEFFKRGKGRGMV